jgi:hypothetical protein
MAGQRKTIERTDEVQKRQTEKGFLAGGRGAFSPDQGSPGGGKPGRDYSH